MSQPKSQAQVPESMSEADIADYLRGHPDFFERHQSLLLHLKLPHQSGSAAVSLVERQIAMLRQRNAELDRQLKDLVAVAKANNELVDNIHKLALRLMLARTSEEALEELETSLREEFRSERAVLILFGDDTEAAAARPGFVRTMERDSTALKPFATFLQSSRPRCGPLRERQKSVLFEREADSIVSAAMVPIGAKARLGFLAIGSNDPEQFNPGQRVDFLGRIGELIAAALDSENARSERR